MSVVFPSDKSVWSTATHVNKKLMLNCALSAQKQHYTSIVFHHEHSNLLHHEHSNLLCIASPNPNYSLTPS